MNKSQRIPGISIEGALGILAGILMFVLDKMAIGGFRMYIVLFCVSAILCLDSVVRSEWAENNRARQRCGGAAVCVLLGALAIWIFGFHVPPPVEKLVVAEKSEPAQPINAPPDRPLPHRRKSRLPDQAHT